MSCDLSKPTPVWICRNFAPWMRGTILLLLNKSCPRRSGMLLRWSVIELLTPHSAAHKPAFAGQLLSYLPLRPASVAHKPEHLLVSYWITYPQPYITNMLYANLLAAVVFVISSFCHVQIMLTIVDRIDVVLRVWIVMDLTFVDAKTVLTTALSVSPLWYFNRSQP